MIKMNSKTIAKLVIPLVIALISILVISRFASSADFHKKSIESLDDKRSTVMELAAASTAASAAITLIPGDTATPIAEKLADLSTYFLIVLCAIYLEKYLLTITGYAAFTILIPAACILFAANVFWKNDTITRIYKKLAFFGIAIVLIIPASVQVSNMIEDTYNTSIESTLNSAKETTEEIEEGAKEEDGFFSGLVSGIKDGVAGAIEKVENVLNNFIEALAVMLVTSCVIPIVVLMFFMYLVKTFLGVNIPAPPQISAKSR